MHVLKDAKGKIIKVYHRGEVLKPGRDDDAIAKLVPSHKKPGRPKMNEKEKAEKKAAKAAAKAEQDAARAAKKEPQSIEGIDPRRCIVVDGTRA